MILTYVRKAASGKLVYYYWDGAAVQWLEFSNTGEAFDFAVTNRIDFLHQPWTRAVDDRIRNALAFQTGETLQ